MQSAVPHVLATLERTHDPERIPLVVEWARAAGLQVSLDLIYGTPGESAADWQASLDLALAQQPDHISAYALIVEAGTKLARQISRGEVPAPDDDLAADMYELAEATLLAAPASTGTRSATGRRMPRTGRGTTSPTGRARTGGASAPARTATSAGCAGGTSSTRPRTPSGSPRASRRRPAARPSTTRPARVEACCSRSRLVDGLPTSRLGDDGRTAVAGLIADGLIDGRRRDRRPRRADAARPPARRRGGAAP